MQLRPRGYRDTLKKIYDDFNNDQDNYNTILSEILALLNKSLQGNAHSIRARVKDPDHLIGKIIRNINERPAKYEGINENDYHKIITDLIGVRVIILNKHDWKAIHLKLLEIFPNIPARYAARGKDIISKYNEFVPIEDIEDAENRGPEDRLKGSYHAEQPVVYITSPEDRREYTEESLRVDDSKEYYRSIHYIIQYGGVYFEIQVRTLFEEGWLEFDHRIKYPYDQNNGKKEEFIGILNALAVAADRLIAFYNDDDFKMSGKKQKAMLPTTVETATPPETLYQRLITKY